MGDGMIPDPIEPWLQGFVIASLIVSGLLFAAGGVQWVRREWGIHRTVKRWMREDDSEQTRRMFYRMEGWDRFWPYEDRPAWLRRKYP